MKVYLPDAERGFYRGVRFDRSGIIAGVQWAGHEFFGPWQGRHNPTGSDHVLGPAEEFGMSAPPGYADAPVGGTFLKIGVGVLRKPDEPKYWFPKPYEVVESPAWEVTKDADSITFRQRAENDRGYGYDYTKTIRLTAEPPGFVIAHRLQNSGKQAWKTDTYCHNFVVLDGRPISPDTVVTLPFEMPERSIQGIASIAGKTITFQKALPAGASLYAVLEGARGDPSDNAALFEDRAAGVALSFAGDRTPDKLVFYGIGKAVCVEPFLTLDLQPGEETKWETRYTLHELPQARRSTRALSAACPARDAAFIHTLRDRYEISVLGSSRDLRLAGKLSGRVAPPTPNHTVIPPKP